MKLTISNKVPPKHTNTFVAEIRTIVGDADGYETFELPFTVNEQDKIAEMLSDFETFYGYSAPWRCSEDVGNVIRNWEFFEVHTSYWPCSPDDDRYPNKYQSYKIFWYDESGAKFKVDVS